MRRLLRSLPALAGGLFAFAAPVAAQQPLHGRVLDANDRPVAGADLVLHGLTDRGGAELDRAIADADGAFTVTLPDSLSGAEAMFFVATRIGGDLFVGPTFREVPGETYVLRAGTGVEPFRLPETANGAVAATPGAAPSEASQSGWWVALIALALATVVALVVYRVRRRPPVSRELFVELATLDERHAAASPAGAAERRRYEERRAALSERAAEALRMEGDAARY